MYIGVDHHLISGYFKVNTLYFTVEIITYFEKIRFYQAFIANCLGQLHRAITIGPLSLNYDKFYELFYYIVWGNSTFQLYDVHVLKTPGWPVHNMVRAYYMLSHPKRINIFIFMKIIKSFKVLIEFFCDCSSFGAR